MAQYRKELQDAEKERNEAKKRIAQYRQKMADDTARLEASARKLEATEKELKSTIERTSLGIKHQLLCGFENVKESEDELEDDDRTAKRPRTS